MRQSSCSLALYLMLVLLGGYNAYADHPNEGQVSLKDLISEATANNLEIKASSQKLESTRQEIKAANGAFYPELSVEGGPLVTKYDSDKNSGTTLYGKAEWNIYRGGRDGAVKERKGIESDLAEKQVIQTKARIEREIARIYYQLLFHLESISLKEKALVMNQEQMKLAQAKNRSGYTSSADVIEFELREATLRSDLKKLMQDRADASRELSALLGRADPSADISVKGHLNKETIRLDREKIVLGLSQKNPELVEAQANQRLVEKEKEILRSGFFPRIDMEGKFGRIANEERVFSDKDNYSLLLKVNIPLFSGLSTAHEVSAAGARVQQNESLLNQKKILVRTEAENLLSQIDSIQERLELEEKTLIRSEEYYKITLGEYRRGVKNSPDMVGAAERLVEARIRNLEYRRDFYLTKLRIDGLNGVGIE